MNKKKPFQRAAAESSSDLNSTGVNAVLLKQARATGQLNLSNRSLGYVPDSVWRINLDVPAEAREASFDGGERWWDQAELNKLILASNQLSELSPDLKLLSGLITLDIHDNRISSIPSVIGELQKLQRLNASHNRIASLPETLSHLASLTVLHLQHNELVTVADCHLERLVCLEDLDLSSNRLAALSDNIGTLTHLSRINVSENKLTALPAEIGKLTGLKFLDASHNALCQLPDSMGNMSQLQLLYVRHNNLVEIPLLSKCTGLKELYLGNNCIVELPVSKLQPLQALSVLDLRDNKLSVLPDEIALLQCLQRLDLTNNSLSGLPYEMGRMGSLTSMQLEGNPLRSLRRDVIVRGTQEVKKYLLSRVSDEVAPSASIAVVDLVGGLTAGQVKGSSARAGGGVSNPAMPGAGPAVDEHTAMVTKIIDYSNRNTVQVPDDVWRMALKYEVAQMNLSHNQLTQFPLELTPMCRHLRDLSLAFNKLTTLPNEIGQLVHLQNIDLRNNALSSLPQELVSLQSLREVHISGNRFNELPEVLYKVSSLENILAGDNAISVINVEGVQKLTRLACLDLQNNNISNVPAELGRCTQLRSLLLSGNPFRNPRAAILAKGTVALLEYLQGRIVQ